LDLAHIGQTITRLPLVEDNAIEILHNGEQAFPAMLEAVEEAQHALYLSSYIFETNVIGLQFIEALSRAAARGVDVRVLIDGVGERYSRPRATKLLTRQGVRAVRFLPVRLWPPAIYINLRNHRKILVADGRPAA
jgi:cardiolipin synthase